MDLPEKDKLDSIREAALKGTTAAQEKKEEKSAAPATEEKVIEQPQAKSLDEYTTEEILAIAEKKGLKVNKEVLSDEQKKKQEEIEEAHKLTFAVEQGLITADRYSELKGVLSADGADLTKKEFVKSYKTENKDANKEDIESAYNDYYNIQQSIKVKEKQINKDGDYEEEVEVEVDKPKFDDKYVKWGENRIKTKAERIKGAAKAELENIDSSYANYKNTLSKASEYSNSAGKVLAEIDFSAYPTKHKINNKEISAFVKFTKPEEIKADVINYLNNDLAGIILRTDKFNDVAEIKNQINGYLRTKYSEQFEDNIWNLGKTQGINEAKVGASSPIEHVLTSDDSRVDQISKEIESRIPLKKDNPLLNR